MKFFTHGCKAWQRYAIAGHPYLGFIMRVSFFYCFLLLTGITLLKASDMHGQNLDAILVTAELKNEPVTTLFRAIEKQTYLSFAFSDNHVKDLVISLPNGTRSVKATLDLALKDTPLLYRQRERNIIIYPKEEEKPGEKKTGEAPVVQRTEQVKPFYAVTGKVTDASGTPIAGVNIIVKGTTNGTSSDSEGSYAINAESADILVFSFIGYKTVEEQVNGRSTIAVVMQEDAATLGEVEINAGYWNVKEKEATGNISKVTAKEISNQPVNNPLQALHGRMPGVYVQQANGIPGSNFTVRIRGQNSILSGNDPLYVIDGVPFVSTTLSDSRTALNILGSGGASPLNGLNVNDIETITVLKDADATAIYGSRGANGVILITTKKGTPGKTKLDVNFYTGISNVANKIDLMNTKEYVAMRKEAFQNDEKEPQFSDYDLTRWDTTRYTDWQKVLIGGNARTTNLQASISGGNSNTQFLFNNSYQKQTTVFPGNMSTGRISSHLSLVHTSEDQKFKATFSLNYSLNSSNLINTDLTRVAIALAPNAPELYDEAGKLNWENSTWQNPLRYLETMYKENSSNLFYNTVIGYEILPGIEIKSNIGINDIRMTERNGIQSTYFDPARNPTPALASIYLNNSNLQSWIFEPQISFQKQISDSQFSVLIGGTFQEKKTDQLIQQGFGYSSDALIEDISAATEKNVMDYIISTYRYSAIFTRINYNFKGKYILNLTGRRDGSSRFGSGKQFGNFGAIGAAWLFSKEKFIENQLPFLSYGKLRLSFGSTGNDQIGDYNFLDTFSSGTAYNGISSLSPTRLWNPNFSWEVNRKFETGIELGFLDDRILVSASYYQNRSSNQLITYPLAMTTGFTGVQANLGATVENRGMEIELNSINVRSNSFQWTTAFNLTVPKNELLKFPGLETSTYANSYVIGQPITIAKRYEYLGVDPQTGRHDFSDLNGDAIVSSADQLKILRRGQEYFGGLNNSLTHRGWQLDIFFQFVKQTAANYWGLANAWPGQLGNNQPVEALARWQKPGDEAAIQRFTTNYNEEFYRYTSSDAVTGDASFIRLKNISLSYQFPSRYTWGSDVRLYVQAQNVFTFTNYFGLDPENNISTILPPLRTFVAGVQITL